MKLLKRMVAGFGLAALAVFATVPAATAATGEIDAYLHHPDGDLGDRYVLPGEVTRVVLALRAGSGTVPANSVRGAWHVAGGATWVNAQVDEVHQGGTTSHTYQLLSPTWIQADGPSGPTSGFNGVVNAQGSWTFRNYYAYLQIPADAQPGDVYTTNTTIGTSQTGYTNVGSPTAHNTTLTVRAADVTADTPATGSTVDTRMPVIEGTGQPGQTVTLTDGSGNQIGTGVVGSDGRWAVQSTSVLADGAHTVTATQTDSVGYTSTDTVSFIIAEDAEVPVIDPLVAGGVGIVLLAGAGVYLLAKRRRSLAG